MNAIAAVLASGTPTWGQLFFIAIVFGLSIFCLVKWFRHDRHTARGRSTFGLFVAFFLIAAGLFFYLT